MFFVGVPRGFLALGPLPPAGLRLLDILAPVPPPPPRDVGVGDWLVGSGQPGARDLLAAPARRVPCCVPCLTCPTTTNTTPRGLTAHNQIRRILL